MVPRGTEEPTLVERGPSWICLPLSITASAGLAEVAGSPAAVYLGMKGGAMSPTPKGGGGGGGGGGEDDQSILSSEEVKVVLNAHALDCRCDADCKELG